MDPGIEYERMLHVYARQREDLAIARVTGDPRAPEIERILRRIESTMLRYRRLAMRNMRN